MKLSIITVNLNNKDGLQKTIDSIVSQTFKDYEWILIDGGSTDGSKELLEEYKECFSYWVSEPDNGVYNAMNKGLSHVHGEYVNFMNSGDVFYSNKTLNEVFNNIPTFDIIYGDWIKTKGDSEILIKAPKEATLDFFYTDNICHQAIFIRSAILKEEGFDETYKVYADWAKWIELIIKGHTAQYIDKTICIFEGSQGLSNNMSAQLFKYETERKNNAIPQYICTILDKFIQLKRKQKVLDESKLTIEQLIFLKNHPKYIKILKIQIKISNIIKKIKKLIIRKTGNNLKN